MSYKEKIEYYYFKTRNIGKMSIYAAVGIFGLAHGLAFPDEENLALWVVILGI